jgi:hypothetical protein
MGGQSVEYIMHQVEGAFEIYRRFPLGAAWDDLISPSDPRPRAYLPGVIHQGKDEVTIVAWLGCYVRTGRGWVMVLDDGAVVDHEELGPYAPVVEIVRYAELMPGEDCGRGTPNTASDTEKGMEARQEIRAENVIVICADDSS